MTCLTCQRRRHKTAQEWLDQIGPDPDADPHMAELRDIYYGDETERKWWNQSRGAA
jgi:hypothetical protein